jgi:4-amino-4-deoxy-L-arabinose transferase-like glycosyltransferase
MSTALAFPSVRAIPRWLPIAAILALSLALRLWGLEQNGWGATYYTAAVRSMGASWHNFFFASFDPAGFASLDKPPLAVWLQVASTLLFGFSPFSVLLPQVLEGVAAVGVLYLMVRPRLGEGTALLAALVFAITPAWLAVNRTNNVDSALLLVLLLAAWAALRAIESGRRAPLLGAMALVGVAFHVKMLAAYVVLPVFAMGYFIAAPVPWRRRIVDLALGGMVVAATSLPWVLAYELTPADQRPWIGSTASNSMRELVLGHNGIGRFTASEAQAQASPDDSATASGSAVPVFSRLFVRVPPGPARLGQGLFPVQFAWLLPLALLGLATWACDGAFARGWTRENISLAFWTGWALVYAVVYSSLGGVMHLYYVNTLAPALAVLAAAGIVRTRHWFDLPGWRAGVLPVAVALTFAWEVSIHHGALAPGQDIVASQWVQAAAAAAIVLAALAISSGRMIAAAPPVAFAALCALPLLWDASLLLQPTAELVPSADLYRLNPDLSPLESRTLQGFGRLPSTQRLENYLAGHRGGTRYSVAATTTQLTAPMIIRSGEPAIAMGGIHGLDPSMSPERLVRLVEEGALQYVLLGDASSVSRFMGSELAGREVAAWVRLHGQAVPSAEWRDPGASSARAALYRLNAPLRTAPGSGTPAAPRSPGG